MPYAGHGHLLEAGSKFRSSLLRGCGQSIIARSFVGSLRVRPSRNVAFK